MTSEFEECEVSDEHTRTIVHVDIDCFYAQVEMNKTPSLRNKPLGIQQKNIIVTCNYVARQQNVRKVMPVTEALKVCPDLVLVNGEDLYEYRKVSNHLSNFIVNNYTTLIEKMGFDECFIDVTELVSQCINDGQFSETIGNIFADTYESCQCGCHTRLKIGSRIAQEIRNKLLSDMNLTSSAGISYNKLLAKLAASYRKPNNQTILFASNVSKFMNELQLKKIPGIGEKIYQSLISNNIRTVFELQNTNLDLLKTILGNEVAKRIYDFSFGKDNSQVKIQGKPQSISLEESFFAISKLAEVETKFRDFLNRILILINDDGRVPNSVKISVRKIDSITNLSNREQKQSNIAIPQIFDFDSETNEIVYTKNGQTKMLTTIMNLFKKIINVQNSFRVNLLGLTFMKFQNIACLKKNLLNSFINKRSRKEEDDDDDLVIDYVNFSHGIRKINDSNSSLNKKRKSLNTIDKYFCKKQT